MSEQAPPAVETRTPPTERNPVTTARFRREAWWQIYFPVLAVALLAITAAVLLAVFGGKNGAVSVVGAYSLILVIILALVGGILILALLIALIVGVTALVRGMPPYANVVQQGLQNFSDRVRRVCDRIAGVVITTRSVLAGLDTYLKHRDGGPSAPADNR